MPSHNDVSSREKDADDSYGHIGKHSTIFRKSKVTFIELNTWLFKYLLMLILTVTL